MDAGHQFQRAERLDDVVVRAEIQAEDLVALVGQARQKDHRNAARGRVFLEDLENHAPVASGKAHVEQDQVRLARRRLGHGLVGIGDPIDGKSGRHAQRLLDRTDDGGIVLHDQ